MAACDPLLAPVVQSDWRAPVATAYFVILLAFGGGAGWASIAKIESATISPGVVIAQTNKKTVQHFEGGIVKDIRVRDGDQVKEGDLIIVLDDTQARASLETFRNQKIAARIQEARLVAERDHGTTVILPDDMISSVKNPSINRIIDDQTNNMRERASYLKSQIDVFKSKISQTEQEVKALNNDAISYRQQLVTIDQELGGLRDLLAKQLVPLSRVASLERERIRLQSLLERSLSDAKKGSQSIQETNLTIIQTQKQFDQQIYNDIIEVRKTLSDITEKERVAQDVLTRVEVKAPRTGIVQALKVFTIGAVIRPGDTILEIAPTGDQLTISIQISPTDVDSVAEGLSAEIRFPTYHSRRVPLMNGKLKSVSYDRIVDEKNPQNYYFQGEVSVKSSDIPLEIKDKLKPGMPADVIITNGEQTPLDYFLGPLFDRLGRAMRER